MQKPTAIKTLFIAALLVFSVSGLRGLNGSSKQADTNLESLYDQRPAAQQAEPDSDAGRLSGANPAPNSVELCREMEREILASTVRVEVEMWVRQPVGPAESGLYEYSRAQGDGYGTIQDGRYLVTHNHFDLPLPKPGTAPGFDYGKVRLLRASGDELTVMDLDEAFSVVKEQPETLVLDFGTVGDEGFFAAMGLPSARFADWQDVALQPGMTVAQLDWDGSRAYVRWVTIRAIVTEDGTARLEFASGLTPGASGGGVFWNGNHIGNNWRMIENYSQGGALVGQQSAAALN